MAPLRDSGPADLEGAGRRSPRLHHVRGHLVRRDSQVFWRLPHLRGNASRGVVRSRTVCLSFARTAEVTAGIHARGGAPPPPPPMGRCRARNTSAAVIGCQIGLLARDLARRRAPRAGG